MGGFEVVDPRYGPLYERAVEVLESDPRVLSVRAAGRSVVGRLTHGAISTSRS
jgi:hypothetical protein